MSDPALFQPRSPRDLADLVAGQPLAWIVSGPAGALSATPLPVQLECDAEDRPLRLLGHFARSNPQWRAFAEDPRATVLLIGPHGYVSPSWFADRSRAPTWNYASAVFEVDIELRDTPGDADRLLRHLVDDVERGRPGPWSIEEMGPRYLSLREHVVGFHAHVRDVRATFKLGQDERDDVFDDILRGLWNTRQHALAGWMRRFDGGRGADAIAAIAPRARPIDPEIAGFIDSVIAEGRRITAGRTLDWPTRREIVEQVRRPWRAGGPAMPRTEEILADTRHGPVRLRIHDPAPGTAKPTLGFLHGGGWAMFSLDTHDRVMRELAARAGVAVVGIDYALSPEVRYPVALEQVVDVVRWLQAHGAAHGLDGERLALGGDSAGGNLSTGAALKLRDLGEGGRVSAVLSYYAGFTPDCSPHSRRRYGTDEDMLTAAEVDTFWNYYISGPNDRNDPCIHGLLADVEDLPPYFIGIGECDVLAEQNLTMAGKLLAAGVPVDVKLYKGAPHSFIEAVSVSSIARQALEDGAAFLRRTFGLAGAAPPGRE
ncbi:alpha/beta hydrolase fold domain-containing protein [Luteimonas sp. BDR2-5]|uniref:alpha/beta hydrolase fold domain-containing protein n=1 Tax=Proluteimonas luteida TaxID=2878685 RepID=UPI001E2F5986|nr:alpha/beta hydrolase fold domain-containing protein [Luteimonas sp. BDR2-5]MCD9028209.1 alpha/beta hydrolase fold domain-containing protein [Luteimonas sp. BDR2-5]